LTLAKIISASVDPMISLVFDTEAHLDGELDEGIPAIIFHIGVSYYAN
jgi:hypothetical protein